MHPNTVAYRAQRAEPATDLDLADPEGRLVAQVPVKIIPAQRSGRLSPDHPRRGSDDSSADVEPSLWHCGAAGRQPRGVSMIDVTCATRVVSRHVDK